MTVESEPAPLSPETTSFRRTFMIALDRSSNAHYAFLWAKQHLNISSEDCIVLVTVCEPISPPAPYGHPRMMYIDMSPIMKELHEEQRQHAHGILRMHGHALQQDNINVKAVILHGDPGSEICRKAEELEVDGLILGSRGMGTIKRMLLGSVSSHCVHHCTRPVIVVKMPRK